MTIVTIKKSAKALLKGYWLRSLTAVTLALGVSAIASIIAEVALTVTATDLESVVGYIVLLFGSAAGTVLSAPVLLGYKRVLWLRTKGDTPSLAEVLYLFGEGKRLWQYLWLYLLRAVLIILPALALGVPVLLLLNASQGGSLNFFDVINSPSVYTALISLCCVALVFLGMGLSVFQAVRYMVSDYIFIENENCGVLDVLRQSSQICLNNIKVIIRLAVSFVPWLLLNLTGFGRLYTTPYINSALACFTRWVLTEAEPCEADETTLVGGVFDGDGL